ncbi:hypothetical protein [Kribbella jejuensis]|uniref:hypothetical protein n=1 Tax=Kribbella jejuensis TaxID=236068 RepID=UPI0031D56573
MSEECAERFRRQPRRRSGPDQFDAVRAEFVEAAQVVGPLRDPLDHLVRGGLV